MAKKPSIWIIIDHKVGNANQAIAVAKAMSLTYEVKSLRYNFLGFLPNWLKFDSLMGVDFATSSKIEPPYPDIVISSGRKTAAVSNYIKKQNPASFIVHLMNPDLPFENFDLVCLPFHDASPKLQKFDNIIYTIGAPTYLDKAKIAEEGKVLQSKILDLKPPFISLMIGGKTKEGDYTKQELQWLVSKASQLANNINGSLLITTSRRTDQSNSMELTSYITAPYFFYDWHQAQAQNNPYLGFLSLSDYFIVTGESVSICCETLATGKPVYIYRKENILYKKHIKFLDYLGGLGYTRVLKDETSILEKWDYKPLKEADKIFQVIKEKLNATVTFSS